MKNWNSIGLGVTSQVFGWCAFVSWSVGSYPQVILNFRRKSVVGLNFDFVMLNFTKHTAYLIYNAVLYFNSAVQQQYHLKYGSDQMVPVEANDVAFAIHAVFIASVTLFQISIYERKSQKFSKTALGILAVVLLSSITCVIVTIRGCYSWLWLISIFNIIQGVMTIFKYIPQAFMNFRRKSTEGFSIGNILLDLIGGLMNYGQMIFQSIDQKSLVNFYGNIGKTLISLVSFFFDVVFIIQHYGLYPAKKRAVAALPDLEMNDDRQAKSATVST